VNECKRVQFPAIAIGAVLLWGAAVGGMIWLTITRPSIVGLGWAILLAAAAACWTVIVSLRLGRQAMVAAIVRKVALLDSASKLSQI